MPNQTDYALIAYVNQVINTGSTRIVIPMSLVQTASKEALETVRQLCKLAGVDVQIGQN